MAIEITDANFEELVVKSDKPVMIDFWAVWCGPCRVIGPIVEEIADEYGDRVVVGKLDVDANRDTAVKYGIQAIPTLLLVNNGEREIFEFNGVLDEGVGANDNVDGAIS